MDGKLTLMKTIFHTIPKLEKLTDYLTITFKIVDQ